MATAPARSSSCSRKRSWARETRSSTPGRRSRCIRSSRRAWEARPGRCSLDARSGPRPPGHAAEQIGERTKLVIVCNPNNPTGTSVGAEAFDRLRGGLPPKTWCWWSTRPTSSSPGARTSRTRWPGWPGGPGTIVLRTFSKIYGLAGLRIGYGVADPSSWSYLQRARHPFNVNRLAEVAALAALDDDEHVERTLEPQRRRALDLPDSGALATSASRSGRPTPTSCWRGRGGRSTSSCCTEGVIVRPMGGLRSARPRAHQRRAARGERAAGEDAARLREAGA